MIVGFATIYSKIGGPIELFFQFNGSFSYPCFPSLVCSYAPCVTLSTTLWW
jgi:hypothetical protein